ncbi:hypothetical protein [Microbulbifer pacificus]|uniref:Uncharacterized protein n=1 Tax=Microbulbifer pacificus TaxID=407164 RepID=A0AAU0N441_9GAMM|nr:hypothetical protein [Microbulbifer pacificus]WOX07054.1 hypothetical protein R5R33_07950 [Microbulbifer pacificus]
MSVPPEDEPELPPEEEELLEELELPPEELLLEDEELLEEELELEELLPPFAGGIVSPELPPPHAVSSRDAVRASDAADNFMKNPR